MKAAIARSKLNHIKFVVTRIATNDNRVAVIRAESNLLTNNCIVVNKDIRRTTTNFVIIEN
jgi:hypothetical protein